MKYKHIEYIASPGLINLWLNRPQKRNAFDDEMILEIDHAIQLINDLTEDIIVVLRGRGDIFCAGADLDWMHRSSGLDPETNYQECLTLTQCLFHVYTCKKVTLAVVQGAAYGGGIGLAAACDMVICADQTVFSLSELRMGLVASSISPYILKKLGESRTRELILTGRKLNGKQAESCGLVNHSVPLEDLDSKVHELVSAIRKGSEGARILSKSLIHQLVPGQVNEDIIEKTARLLADIRVSEDAQQRMKVFLTKVNL